MNRGNEPKLPETAVQITYIFGTIASSLLFTIILGLWLALVTLVVLNRKNDKKYKDKSSLAMIKAVKWVSVGMLLVEVGLFIGVMVFSAVGKASWFIYTVPLLILFVGLICGIAFNEDTFEGGKFWPKRKNIFCCKLSLLQISTFIWACLTSYHISWLVIGIMVNALWGIAVLFFFCLIIVVFIFIIYSCFNSEPFFATFLVLSFSIVGMVIFVGPPGFGSSTADDVVKIVIVPIATGIIPLTFHFFRNKKENGATAKTKRKIRKLKRRNFRGATQRRKRSKKNEQDHLV